jgi:hypothetical protein
MKRSHRNNTDDNQYHHDHGKKGDFLSTKELEDICTAAKHLDATIIREKLLNPRELLKYRNNGKDSTLIPSSILASRMMHTVRSILELSTQCHPLGGKRKRKSPDNWDETSEGIAALLLRAMLLLPPCSSTPWDTIKIFVQVLLERKEGNVRASDERAIIKQKSIVDIKCFLSRIFGGKENDNDKQCMNSLVNVIQEIGDDVAIGIYTQETLPKSSAVTLFQILVSLYNVSKRMKDYNTPCDATMPFCEMILNDILNHDGCVVAVDSSTIRPQLMVLSLAFSVASHELREDLKPHHWYSLQQSIMRLIILPQYFQTSTASIESIKELSSNIALQILLDAPRMHMQSSKIWSEWVNILLCMYQWSTFDKQHFNVVENQMSTFLSNLQPWGIVQFLKVTRDTDSNKNGSKVKEWARVNAILLAFDARVNLGEDILHNFVGHVTNVDIDAKEACVGALIDLLDQCNNLSSRMVGVKNSKTNVINMEHVDLFGVCCDLKRFFSLLEKCKFAVKESTHLGMVEEKYVWDHMELWKRFAFYCMDATPTVSTGRNFEVDIMMSSAILVAVYFEVPSECRQGLIQDISDRLSITSTAECHRMRIAWYSWTLMMILSGIASDGMMPQNEDDLFIRDFLNLLGILDKNMGGKSLPEEVVYHVFRPMLCDTERRAQILEFCKQEIASSSSSLLYNEKPNLSIDCLILLVGNYINDSDTLESETLEVMAMISDEIHGGESLTPFQARRLNRLGKLISACRSGVLCRVALERIRMACISRLIPFLKKNDISDSEALSSPAYCDATCHELDLLIHLFLASCCGLLSDELEAYDVIIRDNDESENQHLQTVTLRDGSVCGNTREELSLVIRLLNTLVRFQTSGNYDTSSESSAEDDWKELLSVEKKFWHLWQSMKVCPKWLHNSTILPLSYTRGHIDEDIPFQTLQSDLAYHIAHFFLLLSLNANHVSNESRHSLSMITNTMLSESQEFSASGTCETMLDPSYVCIVIESYAKHTIELLHREKDFCNNLSYETNDKNLETVSRGTQHFCKKLTSLEKNMKSISFGLYESLVDLFITLQKLKGKLEGGTSDLICQPMTVSVLNILRMLTEKISTVTLNFSSFTIYFRIHLKFLHAMSSQISHEVTEDPSSLCEDKTKVMDNLLNSILNFVGASPLRERNSSGYLLDCMSTAQRVFQHCQNALKCCTTRKRNTLEIFVKITVVQLPRILRNMNRAAFHSGTKSTLSSRHMIPHDTFSLYFNPDDIKKQHLNSENSPKMRLAWMRTSDMKLHHYGLSMCLLNFESLWTESTSIIEEHRNRYVPRAINLNSPNSFTYAKDQVLDFCYSISSVMDLMKLDNCDIPIRAIDKIFSLLAEILSTLQHSVECLTSHLDEWNRSEKVEIMNEVIDISVFEAILCITSWMKADYSLKATSCNTTMITAIKLWCKENNNQKESHRKRASTILGSIQSLEASLYIFQEEVKKRDIKQNQRISNLVNLLSEGDQDATPNLVAFLCSNLESSVSILETSGTAKLSSRSTQKRATNRSAATKQTMSRNTVVNEWLELDRNLDDNSSLGGYEDLEDFILPG